MSSVFFRNRKRHLFVGTFWFLFFAYSGQLMVIDQAAATVRSSRAGPLLTIILDGFSLLVTVWVMYKIIFNPAVTVGLALSGHLPWKRTAIFIFSQLIACMCAGAVVKVLFPGNVASLNTTLAPGVNIAQGLFAEVFFTSYLVFVVLILAVEKSRDTFLAPIGNGLALFMAEIPASDAAVAAAYFPGYHWINWIGPGLGALIASGYYRFVKVCLPL
ncbi:aquaporin-like protein [Xylaria acuta]|nr:aquaporin-like protein [Xylaria acuta]